MEHLESTWYWLETNSVLSHTTHTLTTIDTSRIHCTTTTVNPSRHATTSAGSALFRVSDNSEC